MDLKQIFSVESDAWSTSSEVSEAVY